MSAKVILVTGASSGMGKETAKILASMGHRVYAAARRVEKMEDLKSLGIIPMKLDVSGEEQNKKTIAMIVAKEKRIDVLVNNAGFGLYGTVENITMEKARYQFDVNVFGLASLTQAAIPYMRKNKFGRIVNISSMGGKMYTPLGAWYHATKHAIEGWSDCLRLEVKEFGIDVVLVEPGMIKTEFYDVVSGGLSEDTENSPYKKLIDPYVKMMADPATANRGTEASVLGKVIAKAATTKRPKTRYVKGMMAKPLMFIRKYFGDRFFDGLILRAFG